MAEERGEVVGVAAFGWFRDVVKRPGYRFTVEVTIHVKENRWGSGIGRELSSHARARRQVRSVARPRPAPAPPRRSNLTARHLTAVPCGLEQTGPVDAVVVFRPGRSDEEPGRALLRAMSDEMRQVYEGLELAGLGMPSATPADLAPPGGAFLIGWLADTAVCCGGLKRLPDGAVEIKRMFVQPAFRRRGLAGQLLGALEDTARDLGYTVARLDTGPRQPHAQALYEARGYRPIGNFNANPVASFWGEKNLR